jgi:hypothetical protein
MVYAALAQGLKFKVYRFKVEADIEALEMSEQIPLNSLKVRVYSFRTYGLRCAGCRARVQCCFSQPFVMIINL